MTGMFITLDGPGGVGKSTLSAAVTAQLRDMGRPVVRTREPSDLALGQIARHSTDVYRGRAMAHLIAADRYHHVQEEIRPAISQGHIVVCDRYIASSLVLQVLDGVPREEVWAMNRDCGMPDLAVIVNADPDVVHQRLTARGAHSRYERLLGSSRRECAAFREAATFLLAAGVRVLELDATTEGPDSIASRIVEAIHEPSVRGTT